jgi:hypothetical protein
MYFRTLPFDDAPSSDVDLGVIEHPHDGERLVEGSNCNRANVFCFLSSLPLLPQPPWQCLAPTCHLSTFDSHCIVGAGLPIHSIEEVSSVVLLVNYSFIIGRLKMVYPYFTFFNDTPAVM